MNPLASNGPGPEDATCATCLWRFRGGRGRAVERCRRHKDARVDPAWSACAGWTPSLDCQSCGACCREAYHAVELGPREPFLRTHPQHVTLQDGRPTLPRPDGRCVCLGGAPGAWACAVYAERPRTCRDFPVGGQSCVEARRRVGLTA